MGRHARRYALTDPQREAVAANLGLAGRAARRLGRGLDPDDAMGEACVALCKAAAAHDPARGALSTLTHWVAHSHFHDSRKARSHRPTLLQSGDDLLFDAPARAEPDPGDALDVADALATMARRRPADAALLRRHYLDGVPQRALAAEVGCGLKALTMRLSAARGCLRKIIEGEAS